MKVRIVGLPKRQTGGPVPETKGLPRNMKHMANIEAEAGEVYQDNRGGIKKISDSAPSHEAGGVFLGDASRVLEDTSMDRKDKASKTLKLSPGEIHTIFGVKPKAPMSHAKAYEFVKTQYGKDIDRYNANQATLNDKENFDRVQFNTARLNFINREDIPSDDDVFNTLFEHQEAIKAVHGIQNSGKSNKYGGYIRKAAYGADVEPTLGPDLVNGPKSRTKKGQMTTEGKDVDAGGDLTLDEFKQLWKEKGLDLDSYKTNKEAQSAVYDYLAKKDPEQIRQMWANTGLTNLGRDNAAKIKKLGIELAPNPRDPYHRLDVKDWSKLTPDQLAGLNKLAYADDNFHIRTLTPNLQPKSPVQGPVDQRGSYNINYPAQINPGDPIQPDYGTPDEEQPGPGPAQGPRGRRFYEPTQWYDLAPGLAELTDSFRRDPELYNPVQAHELRYKQLNPEAALRANQGDYNAALQALGNEHTGSGARAANISNLTAQKYKANNQIIAEYENQNAGIKNKETEYNTGVRDRQSMLDARSREQFYGNVLRGRDNQRLQRLQAIQDLSRVQQLKARQNASGNLVLQMSPHFDQEGNYNGTPTQFYLPPDYSGGDFIPTDQSQKKGAAPKQTVRQQYKVGDRMVTVTNQNSGQ